MDPEQAARLVQCYQASLELVKDEPELVLPESALPASRLTLKQAILCRARLVEEDPDIQPGEIEDLRQQYVELSRFLPPQLCPEPENRASNRSRSPDSECEVCVLESTARLQQSILAARLSLREEFDTCLTGDSSPAPDYPI